MVKDCGCCWTGDEESVTVTVNENVPVAVGVPLKAPFVPSKIPDGSEPLVTANE